MYTEDDFYPYKYSPLRENHWMLTEKGIKEAERLIRPRARRARMGDRPAEEEQT